MLNFTVGPSLTSDLKSMISKEFVVHLESASGLCNSNSFFLRNFITLFKSRCHFFLSHNLDIHSCLDTVTYFLLKNEKADYFTGLSSLTFLELDR